MHFGDALLRILSAEKEDKMEWLAKWLRPEEELQDVCPEFRKEFVVHKKVKEAKLILTALGVYEASMNGERIGEFVLAPGYTTYQKRLQYQEYDITKYIQEHNTLSIIVGRGWYRSRMPGWTSSKVQDEHRKMPAGLLCQLEITYEDGSQERIGSDETWSIYESQVRFSEIYDGETFDASYQQAFLGNATLFDGPSSTLIPQEGEEVKEQERVKTARILVTPKGETVIDFGQEVTGYVEVTVDAKASEEVILSHAEVLDKEGNFYTENYRSAKAKFHYICKEGRQSYKPKLTFFGFRYIRVDAFPGGVKNAKPENFTAIVVHSQMKRTGSLRCSNESLNKLFDNIVWGQKGNFVDVPTDCPQRDERLGWTGDAQAFIKAACYQYDTEKFFTKWLADMAADQGKDGCVGHVIPDILGDPNGSAAWADAATICPWELYLAYGRKEILVAQFDCMKKWIGYVTKYTKDQYLWTGGIHFGDWLGLDAPSGSYKGSSREDLIASAFYAHSTALVIKAGKVLGEDVSYYEVLYQNMVTTFRKTFPEYQTQTECVLVVHFNLAKDCKKVADQLAGMVKECGVKLQTGFVGTPYLLHVLSNYGHEKLAYSLLLREEYPSWLYSVKKGATTVWEHWDGIMENGDFWSTEMNSFNHYAYGAVADWVYGVAAGITPMEEYPGYEKVRIAPIPDERLQWLKGTLETRHGLISSEWKKEQEGWRYEIVTPVDAMIEIGGKIYEVQQGSYVFFS